MTEELRNNIKLIDDFMEWPNGELPKVEGSIPWGNYSNSWDWLFPVIDKINGMGKEYSFATFKTYVSLTVEKSVNKMYKDFSFAHAEYITANQTSKEAAYKLLVKFVVWHNEHVTKTIEV